MTEWLCRFYNNRVGHVESLQQFILGVFRVDLWRLSQSGGLVLAREARLDHHCSGSRLVYSKGASRN